MKIATILFTYNRAEHTRKTLEALCNNTEKPERLFIFHDGYKGETPDEKWLNVEFVIHSVDWCDCEVIVSARNKGLAKAIYSGVSYVLERYDAAIVLEDDCVSHPLFMSFMNKCLEKYENCKQIYSVCGNAIPYDIPSNGTDAYFSGRIDTLGWGTWRDRWAKMDMDYTILSRIKKNAVLNKELETWGRDFEGYLLGNIYGKCSVWSSFWGMTVIENKGYSLHAYDSLIEHIGYDGSGTNCGVCDVEQRIRSHSDMHEILLPDEICIMEETRHIYREYSAWTSNEEKLSLYNECMKKIIVLYQNGKHIRDNLLEQEITNVAIWGKGYLADILIKDFEEKINISCIVESNPSTKEYQGIKIVGSNDIPKDIGIIIVIPSYDWDMIKEKVGTSAKMQKLVELL